MIHFRRYLAALATLSLLCTAYWAAAAPWLAPPKLKGPPRPAANAPLVAISPHVQEELTRLFPPGAWELDPATKVLETDRCTLLIKDYLPTSDGRLKLNPCTLIFYSSGLAARDEAAAGRRRPIVLQAPAGAELEFDRALDLTKVTFGRLIGGHLNGEITISSPPSLAGSRDALLLKTRSVSLNRQVIKTYHPVEFRYGDSEGRGSDLEIKLLQPQAGLDGKKTRAPLGGMQSLRLGRLEYVRIATEGRGILGEALADDSQPGGGAAPLEIKCQGWFEFDVLGQVARFVDQVEVLRLLPGSPPDKLLCDELLLTFLVGAPEGAALPAATNQADPLAGRLQRIVALGAPAVLEAPASGISAKAAWMEYEMGKRRITLRPDAPETQPQRVTQVSLRQHEQQFTARELQYEIAEGRRLGSMWAAGPGEIKLLQGRGRSQQIVTARWEKELWVRPQDPCQVISLIGAASVIAEPLGRFDADELHLWVLEVAAEKQAAAAPAAAGEAEKKPRTTLLPDRLLAKRRVRLTSPQLDAETEELQAWFKHLPPAAEAPAERAPPGPGGPLREPVVRAAFQQGLAGALPPSGAIRNVIRPPNLQKFRVVGEKIQMQLAVRGREFDLEDLTIERRATIDETRTPEPGQEPIHVAGDLFKLRHGTTPEAKIEVSGQPAEVAGRGMSLVAGMIHVHRGENRMWIDGPGEATLPAPDEQSLPMLPGGTPTRRASEGVANAAKPPQKLHLVWQQGLVFDGSIVTINGDVQARTATQTARSQVLEATLSQRVDFLATERGQQPELAKIELSGEEGVYLTNRGKNELDEQVSFDQAQFPRLTVDQTAGTLHAPGPGWVSTVRRSAGLPGLPAAPGSNAPPPPIQPPGASRPTAEQPLTSVHISFQRALVGNLDKRQIEFQGDVRTTYSPAADFSDRIVVINVADLTEQTVLMTSDRLTVTEMITPVQRWIEAQATGRTIAQGRTFHVNTPGRLSYTSATEYITIEGDGRANAVINYQSAPGERFNPISIEKARYNIRTGEFDGGVKSLEFFIPGKGLKLNRR